MGVEPMNTGFADQRVSHFATGAHWYNLQQRQIENPPGMVAAGGF